ncbi:hypothetical protein KIN20_027478 [Parelaphostrongylus tenuis]|uniref:Uncharacterized protein n=1 Tax=Parelaphostrongylus tenuis TaxID=148309 RepID=A0AAD5WDW9_PARTN|nr:hypothetical protein KIN20_027478 [Parelaphostrongylus tenuis]
MDAMERNQMEKVLEFTQCVRSRFDFMDNLWSYSGLTNSSKVATAMQTDTRSV